MTTTTCTYKPTSNAIFQWRSIKTRVTLFTLVFFIVGFWSLAFYSSYSLQHDMEHVLGEQQFSTVSTIASGINTELNDRMIALEKVAAKITPAILDNAAYMQTFLEDRPALSTMFTGNLICNIDGAAIADVPTMVRIGVNYADRDFMIEALKGKSTIGKPVMGKTMATPVFVMATPIRDMEDKVLGTGIDIMDQLLNSFRQDLSNEYRRNKEEILSMSDQHTTIFYDIKNLRLISAVLFLTILTAIVAVMGMYQQAGATSHLPASAYPSTVQSSPILPVQVSESIRIGVLAHKGTDICIKMWQPTMLYLNEVLPGRQFDLAPLQYDEVESAVRNRSIDFLICNPAIYVDLEVRYGVTRTMTLRNLAGTQIVSEFGGVVFCRADRSELQRLQDARGQRLAATDETSFGGWYMALREFRAVCINPERDCARLLFLDTHPSVVRAVLSGEADIGTVRTDTIEPLQHKRGAFTRVGCGAF